MCAISDLLPVQVIQCAAAPITAEEVDAVKSGTGNYSPDAGIATVLVCRQH